MVKYISDINTFTKKIFFKGKKKMKRKYINFISEVSKKFISNLNNNLLLKSKLKEMQISIDYTNKK